MPAQLQQLIRLRSQFSKAASKRLICTSSWRHSIEQAQTWAGQPPVRRRTASSLASSTAVTTAKAVPANVLELYEALLALKSQAAPYVNLSRVQLALRSLETTNPVVRIAVLGLDGRAAALKLLKTLLADPGSAEPSWDSQLETAARDETRGLVLRYGATPEISAGSTLVTTLSIPSPVLKSHNVELFVSSIDTGSLHAADEGVTVDVKAILLAPPLDVPGGGSYNIVTYPVHKALVYGEGITGCIAIGRLLAICPKDAFADGIANFTVGTKDTPDSQNKGYVTAIDLELATSALTKLRQSTENESQYEYAWRQSGMPKLIEWLTQENSEREQTIKPAVRQLISSVLIEADASIVRANDQRLQASAAPAVPEKSRQLMEGLLREWAESAHTELRDQLDIAFAGQRWRRLKWWKLFWRVDDIGMIASDILQRRWLIQAEKGLMWIVGRIEQAGFFDDSDRLRDTSISLTLPDDDSQSKRRLGSAPPSPRLSQLPEKQIKDDDSVFVPSNNPWPETILLARLRLSTETVPRLQTLGQTLVVQTLSTTLVSSAVSALVYFSYPGMTIYEAGAIAALGIAWSMSRLQKKWETAREYWESEVCEEGRETLKETEGFFQRIIEEGGRLEASSEASPEDVEAIESAIDSVGHVKKVLDRI